tara:strand:+ start:215 stop:391 length:177 start_codon:yes stop_codon:yes gene_type:complete
MRLTSFWHVLIGLNLGLAVLSWVLQDVSLVMLNMTSIIACAIAAYFARIREDHQDREN